MSELQTDGSSESRANTRRRRRHLRRWRESRESQISLRLTRDDAGRRCVMREGEKPGASRACLLEAGPVTRGNVAHRRSFNVVVSTYVVLPRGACSRRRAVPDWTSLGPWSREGRSRFTSASPVSLHCVAASL